ncbi:hypothetical protein BD410DRAFT_827289 [Rickenella mellea]|uniref:DUF6593 domain-containing protein n=1 Tax=Rickenella mellea TaxID=50990 RepID=A0A4Y7Q9G1_9AGAM|nr:hypothetical protein BD410DRAFT_827289 [Rickenella mellea]
MTTLGMPFLLADKTGCLDGSDFSDLFGRLSLRITRTQQNSQRNAYMVYKLNDPRTVVNHVNQPQASLDFGPNHALGTVSIGRGPHIQMSEYLKQTSLTNSLSRVFTASDGQNYRWSFRSCGEDEWTCVNDRGYMIASYNLKVAGEPAYEGSSGCSLTIQEPYPHLAVGYYHVLHGWQLTP